jgi:ABC-type transporter Mla subunit MlaD
MSVSPRPHASALPGVSRQSVTPLGLRLYAFSARVRDSDPVAVEAVLEPLRAAFADHRAETEGATGSYADVVQDAPRLAHAVDVLVAEHDCIDAAMARLASLAARPDDGDATTAALRRVAHEVLDGLRRHGQHDSDLVHDAYAIDIGGE